MSEKESNNYANTWHLLFGTLTSIIGYEIHRSMFWAVVDFFLYPFVWIKWLIFHEVSVSIIDNAFDWFFN